MQYYGRNNIAYYIQHNSWTRKFIFTWKKKGNNNQSVIVSGPYTSIAYFIKICFYPCNHYFSQRTNKSLKPTE